MAKQEAEDAQIADVVMGLTFSEHRRDALQQVLAYHGQRYHGRWTKRLLLAAMASLERTLNMQETSIITAWCRQPRFGTVQESYAARRRRIDVEESAAAKASNPGKGAPKDKDDNNSGTLKKEHDHEETNARFLHRRHCRVCLELFFRDNVLLITPSCNHEVAVCDSCITQSVESQIDEQPHDQISCPECHERLTQEVVARFASAEAFQR